MTTEALIRALATQVRPVRPVGHPLVRFGGWVVVSAAWITAVIVAIGVREDLPTASRAPAFALHFGATLALGLAATGVAFAASVPRRHVLAAALTVAGAGASWLALLVVSALSTDDGHVGAGIRCVRNLVAFSVPPGLLLYLMLRRAAPLDRGTVGLIAAVGTAALAHLGTRFVCHNDGALHILAWHSGFVFGMGGVGVLLGRALFK